MKLSEDSLVKLKKELHMIFNILGFTIDKNQTKMDVVDPDVCVLCNFKLKFKPDCPIPLFGSSLRNELNILILQKVCSAEEMTTMIRRGKLASMPLIVFQSSAIKLSQKAVIRSAFIQDSIQAAVMDITLLVFVLSCHNRFLALMDCLLHFCWTRPYIMKGETVAVEMFYGRKEEIKSIVDKDGACIVFGGRQLGKSALLRHVVNEYHDTSIGLFIIYLDIDDLGSNFDETQEESQKAYDALVYEFWERLSIKLSSNGFCEFQPGDWKYNQHKKIETVVKDKIRTRLTNDDQDRLIILLDEADDLINADATRDFSLIRSMRGLMADTNRYFKVVFAGLQTIQRHQRRENQPFAQLGTELIIGPLLSEAAYQLVTIPLTYLGFKFKNTNLVLRILSQVNYHPGLIQIFCYRILDKLYENIKQTSDGKTYEITGEDIREIERNNKFMEDIRNRFDWTLDLDDRYKLLIYAMVVERKATSALSVKEFRNMGKKWWEAEFSEIDYQDTLALLKEMDGLGVLVRIDDETARRYQLRSPNLLRLFGTIDDIEEELERIMSQSARKVSHPSNYHQVIDRRPLRLGALTAKQDSEYFRSDELFSTKLIIGSDFTGIHNIDENLRWLISGEHSNIQDWKARQVRTDILSNREDLENFLEKELRKVNRKHLYFVINADLLDETEPTYELVSSIDKRLAKACRRDSKGRIFILLGPKRLWNWHWKESLVDPDLPPRASIVRLNPWTDGAIWHLLEELGLKTRAKQESAKILYSTAGLHRLISDVFSSHSEIESSKQATEIAEEIANGWLDGSRNSELSDGLGLSALSEQFQQILYSVFKEAKKDNIDGYYYFTVEDLEITLELNDSSINEQREARGSQSQQNITQVLLDWMRGMSLIFPLPGQKHKWRVLPFVHDSIKVIRDSE